MKLIIIGGSGGTHIGDAFRKAALDLKLEPILMNFQQAYETPRWIQLISRHLRGKLPPRLHNFSQEVIQKCSDFKPRWLVATGIMPIHRQALQEVGKMGIQRLNYLTDDPWNPAHRAKWFLQALPFYDAVFSVRRANLLDLKQVDCKKVKYLPFGYAPELFYREPPPSQQRDQFTSDVVFVGAADRERFPYIKALIHSGFKIGLYGSFWERFPETRSLTRGQADLRTLRFAISSTKVALCLVRRANRDGNSMRTFEIPAIGACMLTEDTQEHREIFGEEGKAVVYFKSVNEMLKKAKLLLNNEEKRSRLAVKAHDLIVNGGHTYQNRLSAMLDFRG